MREAEIRVIDGKKWVCCPQCGKKAFPIEDQTEIKNFTYLCKEKRCRLTYQINIKQSR